MIKIFKFAILLSLFQLFRLTASATETLPFVIYPGTDPDPIEGYGVPVTVSTYFFNSSGEAYTVPANFIYIFVNAPIGMDLELAGDIPEGFEFVSFASEGAANSAYFVNTVPVDIDAYEFITFDMTSIPAGPIMGTMTMELYAEATTEYDYTITPAPGITNLELSIEVPDVEIDPLSVDFVAVYTNVEDCTVNVNWTVSATDAASYEGIQYAVERSFRGSQFEQIAVITPQAGQFSMNYGDKDAQEGVNLYRIKQISIDGQVTYSKTVRADVTCTPAQHIKIYPNPAVDFVSISGVKAGQKVRVFGINGVEIYSIDVQQDNQVIQVNDLPAGAYNVNVSQNGTSVFNGKLIKR